MRAVVQRVRRARVRCGDEVVGEIGPGLLVYVGIAPDDGPADVQYVATKTVELRVFEDEAGKMNRSVRDTEGVVLAVSQFTLYGDIRRGRRPSFDQAAPPELGRLLFDDVVRAMRAMGVTVETGRFQAHMVVTSDNDGPVTILLDSRKLF